MVPRNSMREENAQISRCIVHSYCTRGRGLGAWVNLRNKGIAVGGHDSQAQACYGGSSEAPSALDDLSISPHILSENVLFIPRR